MDLIDLLDTLAFRVSEFFPTINNGGCCVYAAMVGAQLEKYTTTKIIVGDLDHRPTQWLPGIRPRIKTNSLEAWSQNGVGFSHVGIEFEWEGREYHYDSGGVHAKSERYIWCDQYAMKLHMGFLTVKDAVELAREKGWNKMFDRRQIPKLRKLVNGYFEIWSEDEHTIADRRQVQLAQPDRASVIYWS